MALNYQDIYQAFQPQQKLTTPLGHITFGQYQVGELVLNSGKLVACDPLVFPDSEPFTASLPPGRYPVILSVAHIHKKKEQKHDERVAYAMLRLSQKTIVRWEMATRPGQTLSTLEEGEIFGYGVDSGTGCFMDEEAAQIIDESIYSTGAYEESLINRLEGELEKNYRPTWDWAVLCVNQKNQANVIAFHSGWGDGIYASYLGYDSENKIASVVTDFCV
jgi:hypothetical protein